MRQDLRRFRSALLLILAFSLGLGAQLLQAQVSVTPGRYRFGATIAPSVNDGAALGTTSLSWSDLFLASGAVINVGNGEVTITFAADSATVAGGAWLVPTGSASLPPIAGSAYSTTGLFWLADNDALATLAVSLRGSEVARIASAGRFGLSTQTPYATLDVFGVASASNLVLPNSGRLYFRNGANTASVSALFTDQANTLIVASGSALTISATLDAPTANTGWRVLCASATTGKVVFGKTVDGFGCQP